MSGSVVVTENGMGRYQQEVIVGQHRLIADEPENVGGEDKGPDPFEYVMAGLGACTSMTIRMYAERKKLALTGIHVELNHQKIDIDGIKRDQIKRSITLQGVLSTEEQQRLLEIANMCPVHRALSNAFIIDSALSN